MSPKITRAPGAAMAKYATTVVYAAITMYVATASILAAPATERGALGRSVKLTILVDKVMQPEAGWVTEEWMVREAAEAGFNVFSPRRGHDRLDEVLRVTKWCEKYGIYHLPWMRGTLAAPAGPQADGKRLVWADGNEQPLWSPNSDEFWDWTGRYITAYAKMSAKNRHLMGVFLDYENYAPGRQANCYSLSYDDLILGKFARARGIALPELDLASRRSWLEKRGLAEEFARFQIRHWRERCRALREAVDRFDPGFQFCIYPAPGTPFMTAAAYPEWATREAPLILADASTYGRPSRVLPQAAALAANREKLLQRMQIPRQTGIPFIYAGGIDPVVRGADPEFSGKNAVMISEITGGYWIFYEGPEYKKDHREYFKWFTWANRAIAAGNFEVQHEARETPEEWMADVFRRKGAPSRLVAPPAKGTKKDYPLVKLRGDNVLLLACKAGQRVELVLRAVPIARYRSPLVWELRDPKLGKVAGGTIPHGETRPVGFTPESDGIYPLAATAGSCAYAVVRSTVPVGLHAAAGLSLIHGAGRLYFEVPAGVKGFALTVRGSGTETVRANIYDPRGKQAATGQTSPSEETVRVQVATGDRAGGVWSLELTRADEGVLEDCSITLDPRLPAALSLRPEEVFGAPAPGEGGS